MRSILNPVAKIALLGIALSCGLSATTLEKLSMSDMTSKSSTIVRATVISGLGELQPGGMILTHYKLKLSEVWKGKTGVVDVYVPGGVAAGLRQVVPGAPTLVPGVEYMLFLWVGPSGRPQIMGLSQGLFIVTKTVTGTTATMFAERPGASERMIDPATGQTVSDPAVRMPLQSLKSLVEKFVSVTQ